MMSAVSVVGTTKGEVEGATPSFPSWSPPKSGVRDIWGGSEGLEGGSRDPWGEDVPVVNGFRVYGHNIGRVVYRGSASS
jgi:hypothetical protein